MSGLIAAWAAESGGAEKAWESGEGDARLIGWQAANGTRAIETNADPVWSESEESFADCWAQRSLSPEVQP